MSKIASLLRGGFCLEGLRKNGPGARNILSACQCFGNRDPRGREKARGVRNIRGFVTRGSFHLNFPSDVRLPPRPRRSRAPTADGAARRRPTCSVGACAPRSAPPPRGHTRPGGVGTGRGRRCAWGAAGLIGHPEGARSLRPPHGTSPRRDPSCRAPPRGPPGVRRRRSGLFALAEPLAAAAVRPPSLPVVTRPPAMAAAGGARLLRAASAALGGAARRWQVVAGPRAAPGRGGGAGGLARTLSVSAPARSSSEDKITVHFVNRDGETLTAKGKVGDSLLDVVIENNLDIDGFGEYGTFLKIYK
uniref:Adrenodoxin, mitochondrial n=1 Tax=Callorhinus ursinus TaxID=34884 RepID=A0A3Q7QU23_CALUR|nr:adrenodoxin, mitochondrial [Callorhinus ursinus]